MHITLFSYKYHTGSTIPVPTCYELGNCDVTTNPLNIIITPFTALLGESMTYAIVWSVIIGFIWLRTHDPVYTGMVGVFISGALITGGVTILPEALWVGVVLLGVSVGLALYNLITKRLFGA